jgi:hypothetical protein
MVGSSQVDAHSTRTHTQQENCRDSSSSSSSRKDSKSSAAGWGQVESRTRRQLVYQQGSMLISVLCDRGRNSICR